MELLINEISHQRTCRAATQGQMEVESVVEVRGRSLGEGERLEVRDSGSGRR